MPDWSLYTGEPTPPTAPQPVAPYLKDCVKEGPDCDCVGVCKFKPVAGEGPQTCPDCGSQATFELNTIGTQRDGRAIYCNNMRFHSLPAPEGTPTLEEIAREVVGVRYKLPVSASHEEIVTATAAILCLFITPDSKTKVKGE